MISVSVGMACEKPTRPAATDSKSISLPMPPAPPPAHKVISQECVFSVSAVGPQDHDKRLAIADYLYATGCQKKGRMTVLFQEPLVLQIPGQPDLPDIYVNPPRQRLSLIEEFSFAEAIATIDSITGERRLELPVFPRLDYQR
jgi:hypothetical protein